MSDYIFLETKGATPLMEAACNSNVNMLNSLINSNVTLDDQDNEGMTALMYACNVNTWCIGRINPCINALILAGASLDIQDNKGRTALMYAATNFGEDHFITSGASLDIQDNDGDTALMRCIDIISEKTLSNYIKAGASLDLQNNKGQTVLQMTYGYKEAEVLIKIGRASCRERV